jgi:thiol:disulfide interchange protein
MGNAAIRTLMWALALIGLTGATALAQGLGKGGKDFGSSFGAPATVGGPSESEPEVSVSAAADFEVVAPGDVLTIAVVLNHAANWHTWPSAAQDVLPPEVAEFAIRTAIDVEEVPAWVDALGTIQWPEPYDVKAADPMGGAEPITVKSYKGKAIAYLPVRIAADAQPGAYPLSITVRYQACDDTVCLMPATDVLQVGVTIGASSVAAATSDLFDGFAGATFDESSPASEGGALASGGPTFFGITIPTGGGLLSLLVIGLLSALGGAILNLTPCVLPVIPIKIMTLTQHAGEHRGKTLFLGLMMFFGVVAFWAALALPVLLIQGFADPSRIFGIWWLTTGIGVLIAVMSLGLMGMFSLNLPKSAYMVNPKADTASGSFLFGVMAGVLGLPCFGFVAGALVPIAASQGVAFVITLFTSMGIGMGAPYLILSAKPEWVSNLPRTGPASDLVKQVMGLLLLAAAAYFVGSGLIALVSEKPYIAKQLHLWVAALFGVGAGGWLVLRTLMITKSVIGRGVFGVVGLVLALGGSWLAWSFTSDARTEYLERQAAIEAAGGQGEGQILLTVWNDYSPALVQEARDQGKVVVMDFTAEWCINCKALKKAVLMVDPVVGELRSDDVVMVTVDLTGSNKDGEAALAGLNRTGIPTLAVYGPGLDQPWVSSAYTSDQVMRAIQQARGEQTAGL